MRLRGTTGTGARSRRPRSAPLFVVVAAAVLAMASCETGVWMGPASRPAVSVIGDSLTFQAEGNYGIETTHRLLADELVAAGYRAHVSGYIGHTTEEAHRDLWPLVQDEPDLDTLVIETGSNDAHDLTPLETSRMVLRQWLVEAAAVRCVALIGVNVHAYGTDWRLDVLGPPYNQMLVEEAARHPNAIVVPWEPDLDVHGHTGDVHFPDDAARAQFRAVLRGAVERCATTNPPAR